MENVLEYMTTAELDQERDRQKIKAFSESTVKKAKDIEKRIELIEEFKAKSAVSNQSTEDNMEETL